MAETAIVLIVAAAGAVFWRVGELAHESDTQFERRLEFAAVTRSVPRSEPGKIKRRNGLAVAKFAIETTRGQGVAFPADGSSLDRPD